MKPGVLPLPISLMITYPWKKGKDREISKGTPSSSPHGVQQGAILRDPQEFVGHGHVVCHGLLSIVEKGVWGPYLACH